jgi:hypothetical protein
MPHHRNGSPASHGRAALTYARRYALFTLVGIAGEDDIDASDLDTPTNSAASRPKQATPNKNARLNGEPRQTSLQPFPQGRFTRTVPRASPAPLDPEASGRLHDCLAAELKDIGSPEQAATWAHRVLADKDTLVAADAERIEEAFQRKLTDSKILASSASALKPDLANRLDGPTPRASTKANLVIPNRVEFAIASMSSSLPNSHV